MSNDRDEFKKMYADGFKPWDSGEVSIELKRVLDAGSLKGKTALEIGCGTGTNALELVRRGFAVTACDFVKQALDEALKKAADAGIAIDFHEGDALKLDLGGPFDMVFDRGVYHHIRRVDLPGFHKLIEKVTRPGTRWLSLAGHSKESSENGPPTVSEPELRAEWEPYFTIIDLQEFRFGTNMDDFRPLAWSILLERKE